MTRRRSHRTILPILLLLPFLLAALPAGEARAFTKEGCGGGECRDCHTLSRADAGKLLAGWVDNVTEVREAPVRGLYAIDAEKEGRKGTLYMDYAKRHVLLVGQIIRLETGEDVSQSRKADLSAIPADKGIVLGKGPPSKRILVFTDPDCHFCVELHKETKKVREKDPSVSFVVLPFSRNNDPAVTRRAAAALCAGTEEAVDRAYDGQDPGESPCGTERVAAIAEAAGKAGLRGTPCMIFPDGRMVVGKRDADVILKILAESQGGAGGKGEGTK